LHHPCVGNRSGGNLDGDHGTRKRRWNGEVLEQRACLRLWRSGGSRRREGQVVAEDSHGRRSGRETADQHRTIARAGIEDELADLTPARVDDPHFHRRDGFGDFVGPFEPALLRNERRPCSGRGRTLPEGLESHPAAAVVAAPTAPAASGENETEYESHGNVAGSR